MRRCTAAIVGFLMVVTATSTDIWRGPAYKGHFGVAWANPLQGHDCYSRDVMRRIEGCTQLLQVPGLGPHVQADALSLRALALSLIGRYKEVIADYDRSLTLRPNNAVTLNNRAWALYKTGRIQEAIPDVERSLRATILASMLTTREPIYAKPPASRTRHIAITVKPCNWEVRL